MEISKFIGDVQKQSDGIWVKYPDEDVEFLIAYSEAKEPRDFYLQQLSKNRRKLRNGALPPEVNRAITIEMVARCILKGWKNLEQDGQPLEFNIANARALLTKSSIVLNFISGEAANPQNFGITPDADAEADEGTAAADDLKSGA